MQHISTGDGWETEFGYSRAVVVNDFVFISGTTAFDPNTLNIPNDEYQQTKSIYKKIEKVLKRVNCTFADIFKVVFYVKNIENWELIKKAHKEVFSKEFPTATMVEVSNLIDPKILVEIEVTALKSIK
ncbi:MAG: enamine deaminase RidA (YjgF/YER057c/UK114 family) [Sphingobacteriales bacterium]|jgi:enamine deaminase RidA (YjgF/YER057c/UK114 family)